MENSSHFKKGELPPVGKQFSSEYKPSEKWTEEEAYRLFNDLVAWFDEDPANIFFEEFLFDNPNIGERPGKLYPDLISNLLEKIPSLGDLYNSAKKKQEVRLMKYASHDKINAGMSKFLLSAKHGLKEKSDVTSDDKELKAPIIKIGYGNKED